MPKVKHTVSGLPKRGLYYKRFLVLHGKLASPIACQSNIFRSPFVSPAQKRGDVARHAKPIVMCKRGYHAFPQTKVGVRRWLGQATAWRQGHTRIFVVRAYGQIKTRTRHDISDHKVVCQAIRLVREVKFESKEGQKLAQWVGGW